MANYQLIPPCRGGYQKWLSLVCFGLAADFVFALAVAQGPCEAVERSVVVVVGRGLTECTSASEGVGGRALCRSNSTISGSCDTFTAIVLPPRSQLVGEHIVLQHLPVAHRREMLTNAEQKKS